MPTGDGYEGWLITRGRYLTQMPPSPDDSTENPTDDDIAPQDYEAFC
jgi:hypothetical protein